MLRKLCQCLLTITAFAAIGTIDSHAQYFATRHVRDAVRNGQAQPVGRLPETQVMTLNIVLPLSNQAGLDEFLSELYDPNNPSFHRYLTVPEFTARFGPSQQDYDAVVSYAKSNGFQIIGGTRDGMNVEVKGPVSSIESAFHVTMRTYRHPTESRVFYSPDREPTTGLNFQLWHVSGIDNYSIPRPLYENRNDFAKKHGIDARNVVSHATTGSGPSASFLGSDMRAAYYGNGSLTGSGQTVGLLEYYGTDLADLNTYYSNVHQTNNVPISVVSTDGTSTSCSYPFCDDIEQTLDMTQALGMAPGLAHLTMYVGSTDTSMISAMTTTADGPLPTTIGCSWGWTPADPSTLDPYFQKMAAQGQNFFAASGDSSTWGKSGNAEAWPADDANIVSVGGTDLTTASAAGPWASETAWVDSGGGISPDGIPIPSWQQISGVINSSNKGSTTLRNGPDVSANANFTFYTCGDQQACQANYYGGTSFAAPMWAGYIALVNQQLVANGQSTIGFLNPTIYSQNVTSSYDTDFHDITSGTSGSYSAVTGYDLVTGWGSPNSGLIGALTGSQSTSPSFTLSASPTSLSVAQSSNGASTITATPSDGFNSTIALTASGQPSGVTVGFNPSSISGGSGSSTVTFTVASTTTPGTYTVTITGTGGGVTKTTTVSLTVTSSTASFSLSASPTSLNVTRSSSGSVTITSAASGGFNSSISLSASGQGSGETITFNPTSITGSGTSTMTIKASKNASTGNHTITIKGTSGSLVKTTTVTVDIIR